MSAGLVLAACQREPDGGHDPSLAETSAGASAASAVSVQEPEAPLPDPQAHPDASVEAGTRPAQVLEGLPQKIALPPAHADTPDIAPGTDVDYVCESGASLRISYTDTTARVRWTGDRTLILRRAQDTAGDVYAGEGYTLKRIAEVVQLDHAGERPLRCSEQAANA